MNTPNPGVLYSVEPSFVLLARRLRELTRWIVRLYWDLFVWLPFVGFTMFFAVVTALVGVLELIHHPAFFWRDIPLIASSLCFIIFHRLRVLLWIFLPCLVVWFSLVAVLLIPFLGPDYVITALPAKFLLATADLLPPLVAALVIERAVNDQS